jgi:hypothetical protein
MGGDDSQNLLPWRGNHSSPGRKPQAQCRINNTSQAIRQKQTERRLQRGCFSATRR